ncbi:MAG: hypothetical protein QXP53_01100 [Candidatus Pacearchaeota archaeon]
MSETIDKKLGWQNKLREMQDGNKIKVRLGSCPVTKQILTHGESPDEIYLYFRMNTGSGNIQQIYTDIDSCEYKNGVLEINWGYWVCWFNSKTDPLEYKKIDKLLRAVGL